MIEHASNQSCALPVSTHNPLPRPYCCAAGAINQSSGRECNSNMAKLQKRAQTAGHNSRAKRRRSLEAAWVTARKSKKCLCLWGRVADRSMKWSSKTAEVWAPWPSSANLEGDSSYLSDGGFGRPSRIICQGFFDPGAAAQLGQSRYLEHQRDREK